MQTKQEVNIGLLGLGVVGSGVANALLEKKDSLAEQSGGPLILRKVAEKRSVELEPGLLTQNAEEILTDPQIDIVIEVIGGEHPLQNTSGKLSPMESMWLPPIRK